MSFSDHWVEWQNGAKKPLKCHTGCYKKNMNHPTEFTSFHFLQWGQIFSKIWQFQDLTLEVHGQGHQQGQWSRSYMEQMKQPTHTAFPSCKSEHRFLRLRQFIIWPWNFEVKVTAEFKVNLSFNLVAIFIVIVAQTDSIYGTNACMGI